MPYAAPRPCRFHGCKNTTTNGYCPEHIHIKEEKERIRKAEVDKTRNKEHAWMYRTKGWRTLRTRQLTNQPSCVICGRPATDVHHIIDHQGNTKLFFDRANLTSLCKSCHSRITAKQSGGFGNPIRLARE